MRHDRRIGFRAYPVILLLVTSVVSAKLVITNQGKIEQEVETSDLTPGEDLVQIEDGLFYLWSGEDSIDYRMEDGLLWVDGDVIGVKPGADLDIVPNRKTVISAYGLQASDLKRFPKLIAVRTKIIDADFKHLRRLKKLRRLDVNGSAITDGGLVSVKRLKRLKQLSLAKCYNITDEGIRHLAECKRLENLDLRETQLTDAGIVNLIDLVNLKKLNLRDTRITPKGGARMEEIHPNCEVLYRKN
jgi:Leucine-rich repeat (LRR) protein